MSEYITDAEIDEMVRRLEAHVAVDIRTALRDAVLWGARYAEVRQQSKSGGWIAYAERKPESKGEYLVFVCTKSGDTFQNVQTFDGVDFLDYGEIDPDITHWRSLPEPPHKPGGGEELSVRTDDATGIMNFCVVPSEGGK